MTLAQHAGLSFVKNRNPDLLPPPIGPERMDEAVRRTVWLLAIAEELVGANAWERMRLWTPDGSFDLKLEISAVYGRGGGASGEDISTSALFAFWALAGEYRSGKRPMSELDETPCESEQGVVCWNVDATLAGWRTALN